MTDGISYGGNPVAAAPFLVANTAGSTPLATPTGVVNASLRQLRVFVTVARQKSFTRAADEFGLTQSAVSRCIRELEDEIDLRLFDRTTRHVGLTLAGEALAGRIAPLLEEIETTLRDSHGTLDSHRGNVQIASSSMLSSSVMPAYLVSCRDAYPDVSIALRDKAQHLVLQCVRNGSADFGVVANPDAVDDLHTESLFSTALCVVLPPAHPLAVRSVINWTDLDGAALLALDDDSGSRQDLDRALATHHVHCRAVQELAHFTTVFKMVEAGLGLGVVPSLALSMPENAHLIVRTLVPEVRRTTMLVCRKNRSLRPSAATIWTHMLTLGQFGRLHHQTEAAAG